MSNKRTSTEFNNDDKSTEGSDSDFQEEDNAKRTKLTLLSDTTLQDLPIELLERLLVEAVVMEVKGMKLAKCVWKVKADLVMSRLETVCSQWSSILMSNIFRSEVHRILDGTAQETFRLEILHQSPIHLEVIQVTTVKDEIFMLYKQKGQAKLVVYDRNNAVDEKDVIVLPGISPVEIAGCNASNCVYVLHKESNCHSVLRITKEEEHLFNTSPWIGDLRLPVSRISVSPNGNLVIFLREFITDDILSGQDKPNPALVKICDLNGSLLHEIILSPDIFSIINCFNVIQKSNGNLLMVSTNRSEIMLTEIDTTGRILRQRLSALTDWLGIRFVDIHGRILLSDERSGMELYDSELNPLDFKSQKQYEGQFLFSSKFHYNSERNEMLRLCELMDAKTRVFTIFRFTEE